MGADDLCRRLTGLRTPAAIQVVAARLRTPDAIVTNDRRWVGRAVAPAVVLSEEYVG